VPSRTSAWEAGEHKPENTADLLNDWAAVSSEVSRGSMYFLDDAFGCFGSEKGPLVFQSWATMRCGGSGSVAVARAAVGPTPPLAFDEPGCLWRAPLQPTALWPLGRAPKRRMVGSLYQYTGQSGNVYRSESLLEHRYSALARPSLAANVGG